MSTPTLERIHTEGVPVDALIAFRDQLDEAIAAKVAAPAVEISFDPDQKISSRKASKNHKGSKKGSKKSSLKKASTKVAKTSKKVVKTAKKSGRSVRAKVKSGARKARRGVAKAGRKMWAWATTGARSTWSGMTWVGRKLAGAAAWTFGAGAKVIGWVLSSIGWGWALVAVGGLLVLTLVLWAVNTSTETIAAPLKWVGNGRPGSLKSFKAKRKSKRDMERQAHRDQIDGRLQTRKARKMQTTTVNTDNTAVTVTGPTTPEVETQTVVKQDLTPQERTWLLAVSQRRYQGMSLKEILAGASLKEEELSLAVTPDKNDYSFYRGMNQALEAVMTPNPSPLRGKQLYQRLRELEITSQPGETKEEKQVAASRLFNWTKYQAGISEVMKLIERVSPEDDDVVVVPADSTGS